MNVPRWLSRGFAIVSVTLALLLLAAAAVLEVLLGRIDARPELPIMLAILAIVASYPIVGALLVLRQPGNRVGWLFSAIGLGIGVNMAGDSYAYYDHVAAAGLPGVVAAAWAASWIWILTIPVALSFTLMLFPDGRLPSRRWRPVAWLALTIAAAWALSAALVPGPLYEFGFDNPFGVEGAAGIIEAAERVTLFAFLLLIPVSGAAVVVRLRRAVGIERQQMKWFVFVAAIAVGSLAIAGVLAATFGDAPPGEETWLFRIALVAWITGLAAFSALPVAVAIAILRYRLYDIDLIIRRTLVYGAMTATLAAVYVGGVLALQAVLGTFTEGNALAVAASTLGVAALFRPLRHRLQIAVDRRFYRSRYDAQRTLEAFDQRLRDEVDLHSLTDELCAIVQSTMQPSSASVWVRRGEERGGP
jgi:hypothetical protein